MSDKHFFLTIGANEYKRLVILASFLFLLFFLLIVRFYEIQIVEGDKWNNQALCQHHCKIVEPFMRGSFISNNTICPKHLQEGSYFVVDVPKFHLFIDPKAIPNEMKSTIIKTLTQFFELSLEEKKRVSSQFFKESHSRQVLSWLDQETKDRIEKWWFGFIKGKKVAKNCIFFIQDYKRSYPFGSLLGQVLHTVRDQKDGDFQGIPTGGLELYFDRYLRGKVGIKEVVRSPTNLMDSSKIISPSNGADIYLTINQYVQAIVEDELEKGVKRANAKGGWAIMMDPKSGEILALGQYPLFDLKEYAKYFNDPKMEEHTRVKAITDTFEPGSIFKPITLAIMFKANEELKKRGKNPILRPQEKIATSNGKLPGTIKPLKDGRVHRYLNMYLAIQKSSNVYMGQMVKRLVDNLGINWYKEALNSIFGFGKKTNVELPGESPGIVPTPGKLHPNGTLEWSAATPYSLAIGHNILVNSLQILRVYAIIANQGLDVHPTLIRKIVNKDQVILDNEEVRKNQKIERILEKESCQELIKAMKYTTKIGGTARLADIPGFSEGGKTGTSEKIINGFYSDKYYISSFVGFAPSNNPRFVLMIVIDEPEKKYGESGKNWHGGACAAPIFQEIGRRTLEYLGVEPDDPFGYPYKDPRSDHKKADWSSELEKLQNLYKSWNQ